MGGAVAYAQYPGFDDPGARQIAGGTGSGGLTAVEREVDGGTVPVGATAQVVIVFRNEGSQPVQTGLIRLYPSSTVTANVALNQCEEDLLPAGADCAIAVTVKGLQAGSWRVEMLMSHSGRSRLVTATLSGQVEASGDSADKLSSDIETIPEEIDFGALSASQTLVEPVVLRNVTSNPVDIKDIYIDTSPQAGFALKTECEHLEAGQACIATVTWTPKLKGPSSGVLVVQHSGPAALASVPLRGEYTPTTVNQAEVFPEAMPGRGLLVSSETEVDFGEDVSSASSITLSLVNVGDAPLTIKDVRIGGQDNGLSFRGEGCKAGLILEPIDACPLTVSWSPTRVGDLLDDVQVLHDGARGILVLPVRGSAETTVSQDQKAILLSSGVVKSSPIQPLNYDEDSGEFIGGDAGGAPAPEGQRPGPLPVAGGTPMAAGGGAYGGFDVGIADVQGVLDGYKITSFSSSRAIINGPGGSRIVFDDEEIVLGGVPWQVHFQKNGIEFMFKGQRVLLLFDRSLSSASRVSATSGSDSGTTATTGTNTGG